jgi:hypothetical protein
MEAIRRPAGGSWLRPMLELKSFRTAAAVIGGIELADQEGTI